MSRIAVAAAASGLVFASACGGSSTANDPTPDNAVASLFDEAMPQLLEQHDVEGAALAVVENGEVVWSAGYGFADVEDQTPVTSDTVFQVASLSKPVSAWGVMRLVEDGSLDLDAPVSQYLTRWQLPDSEFDAEGVTVRRLLSHTAGISLSGYAGFPPYQGPLPSLEASLSGDTGGVGDVRLVQEPGAGFLYSGGGYTVLQLLVEEVTDKQFAAYMQREVLQPLAMSSSGFEWSAGLQARTATAYNANGEVVPNLLFTAQAAAGLYATAPDIARFAAATMPSEGLPVGRGVLTSETIDLMSTRVDVSPYGLGYASLTFPNAGVRIGHEGVNQGWRALFVALPERGKAFVVLSNSDKASPASGAGGFIIDALCLWAGWSGEGEAFDECPPGAGA